MTEDNLLTWREGLPKDLKVTTKQRFVNDLKAALVIGSGSEEQFLVLGFGSVPLPQIENALLEVKRALIG